MRAREKNVKVQIVHNASIINAIGCCGLQLYSFGEVVSIPLWTNNWQPDSFFEKIEANHNRNLHTLCLLDIKVKEPDWDKVTSKKTVYLPPKFMTVSEASDQLLQIIARKEGHLALKPESLMVGLARIGSEDQKIVVCTLRQMKETDLGKPLHCLIVPAKNLHPLEAEFLVQFASNKGDLKQIVERIN